MNQLSRRELLTGAAVAFPLFLPGTVLGKKHKPGANDRIRVGVIGIGKRANLLVDQLPDEAEIVAVADCFRQAAEESAAKRQAKWRIYDDYRQLLDQKDIDGVIIGTPDHGRVLPAIRACQAGKDVYAEKPLTAYIAEGRALVKAARKHKRVFQVGTQQRSMAMNVLACDFVQKGGLGKVTLVQTDNYGSPKPYSQMSKEALPGGLNWDVWLGPTPMRPYNDDLRVHWMNWWDYSGGDMTNWGAHGLDQVQSALGMSETGPVELWPLEDGPPHSLGFRYANGVTVRMELSDRAFQGGAVFTGEKGRIEIVRNAFKTDPPNMITNLPAKEDVDKWSDKVAKWQARYHMQNWIDCMRSRQKPTADVEIGHRSVSVCHLANITRKLGRKLHWDPKREDFVGDSEASSLVTRARRKGYELPA
jgi:predicted dehydrogenase